MKTSVGSLRTGAAHAEDYEAIAFDASYVSNAMSCAEKAKDRSGFDWVAR